ncbi:universal stress protein [Streptomyces silaceus]|uniref:universal stress protein n=1 Tax=Streptomyces silaceus TaxID=545123 RepID=UPI000D14C7F5|nr:universal stress protein [Streptomyces silaceus]
MTRPVIAGVDGSPEGFAAAEWAGREALRRDAPLRLLCVRRPEPHRESRVPASAASARRIRRRRARSIVREAEHRVRATAPDVCVTGEEPEGPPAAALVHAAEQAELLVLGSRGLSGITGLLVGSVAQEVVARAPRPVVLVRADERPENEHLPGEEGGPSVHGPYRDVVLGLNLGDPCDEVIEFAFQAARLRDARLRVVSAWTGPSMFTLGPGEIGLVDSTEREAEWRGFLTAVLYAWRDKYPRVPITESLMEGGATAPLVRATAGAGLLVVGRRAPERPQLGPHAGPVAHAVIHHAACPVAVVPHS